MVLEQVSNHERQVARMCKCDQLTTFVHCKTKRLLDVNMLSSFRACNAISWCITAGAAIAILEICGLKAPVRKNGTWQPHDSRAVALQCRFIRIANGVKSPSEENFGLGSYPNIPHR